jgi:hypothetical protein
VAHPTPRLVFLLIFFSAAHGDHLYTVGGITVVVQGITVSVTCVRSGR